MITIFLFLTRFPMKNKSNARLGYKSKCRECQGKVRKALRQLSDKNRSDEYSDTAGVDAAGLTRFLGSERSAKRSQEPAERLVDQQVEPPQHGIRNQSVNNIYIERPAGFNLQGYTPIPADVSTQKSMMYHQANPTPQMVLACSPAFQVAKKARRALTESKKPLMAARQYSQSRTPGQESHMGRATEPMQVHFHSHSLSLIRILSFSF